MKTLCRLMQSLIFVAVLVLSYTTTGATITVDKASPGWTGTITFTTDQDVNLAITPLMFDLSGGITVSSFWGIEGNPSFTQSGSTVTVKVYRWWPADQGYILKANTKTSISFGANSDLYTISNVRLGGESTNPTAKDDFATTITETPVSVNVLANDSAPNGGLEIATVTTPANGTAKINGSSIVYTSKSGFIGSDAFNYTVKDSKKLTATARVSITVNTNQKDIIPPIVSIISPSNGQTIPQTALSHVSIEVSATDNSGSVACVISVDGKTFNGTTASWTPSVFGTYTISVKATDPSGNSSQSSANVNIVKNSQPVTDSGQVYYHLTFPVSILENTEKILLNENYKDLIISNVVAGVLLGHLISNDQNYSNLKYNKDYLYGALFAQLLQEDIDASSYINTTDWLTPNESIRNILLAPGQGGPYQLNDYSKALEHGYGLINFAVLQKSLDYSVKDQGTVQTSKTGPLSLDNKYFGPLAAAYFHYNDLLRLSGINKDSYGPQAAYWAECLLNLSSSDNSFLDMILNATYNAGPWADITTTYIKFGANLNNPAYADKIANINNYDLNDDQYKTAIGTTTSAGTTFIKYPRQIRFYLDEMYNKTTFSDSNLTLQASQLRFVFSKSMSTLAYLDSNNQYNFIKMNDADLAFDSALASSGLFENSYLNLIIQSDRQKIFTLLENAITNLSANLKIEFGKIVTFDLSSEDLPDAPVANPDTVETSVNTAITIDLLANDTGSSISLANVGTPTNGTAVISSGKVVYTPISGFIGTATFGYTISDSAGQRADGNVTVTVKEIATPVANTDTAETTIGTAVTIDVLANDSGSAITITSVGTPTTGTANTSSNKIIYTPVSGFTGTAAFVYQITDSIGQTVTGNVSVNVNAAPSEYPAWDSSKIYLAGDRVSYNGRNYEAKWWTQGENPSMTGEWGVWKDLGPVSPTEDKIAPTVAFLSHYDGQIIKLKDLSLMNLLISATDEGGIASSSIIVEGVTYNGTNAAWVPSNFGIYKLTAFAKDTSGNSKTINITVQVVHDDTEPPVIAKKQIIGYLPQWDAWKDSAYQLPVKGIHNQLNVDYTKYTILNFSFFGVAKDGSLHSADFRNKAMSANNTTADQEPAALLNEDIYSSWDMWILYGDVQYNWNTSPATIEKVSGGAPGLLELGKLNNVKIMASIGGWSMSKHFSVMASDSAKKANFLRDVKKLIDMGFDGIDIDWEYPGPFEGMNFTGSQADFQNFANLMKDIRGTIGYDKLLTAAFSASPSKLEGFNFAELDLYMDYYNMMTYDMEGGWSNNAGHNSPLYNNNGMSWDQTFKYLTQQKGVNPEKINLGAGFYGRGVKTIGTASLGAQTSKYLQTFSVDGSLLSAADFVNWGLFEGCPYYYFLKNNTSGWTRIWDNNAKVPYMIKGNYFLSYDDPESMKYKADYIVLNNTGGVIVWEVFGDMEFSGGVTYYTGNKLPKANTIKTELLDTLYYNMNK
ncbi:MAG TPA: hypothetical protein DD381_04190 [Lentisphaeria bacterium]|nr:MAG: hypothetical protein A2X47_06440 [Lentisphaerae bacterium GWF2_38_69]HBM15531.1 hypothetical protein [Lentisphaeria bacterium]